MFNVMLKLLYELMELYDLYQIRDKNPILCRSSNGYNSNNNKEKIDDYLNF